MKKLMLLVTCLLLACTGMVYGQSVTINGTIVDGETNEPIIGASVQEEGNLSNGVVTDLDGHFSISVSSSKSKLVVKYLGYKDQVVAASNGMRIVMESDTKMLQTVVVETGYGAQTKVSSVGSAAVVDGETIENKNPSDVTKALAGEFAGVQVTNSSGQPGQTGSIQIRGVASVNASTSPLYVVDGIPYMGDIASINPNDIASTTVLKDATATSLYGARGANGVVVITTKKGSTGTQGKIDVDVKYGGNMRLLPLYDVISSPEEYTEMGWQSIYNYLYYIAGNSQSQAQTQAGYQLFGGAEGVAKRYNMWQANGRDLIDPATGKFYEGTDRKYTPENWQDYIFRTGHKFEATVKFSGGSDKTTYYTSFGYLKDQGYYIASDYNRLTTRSNLNFQPKKWLRGDLNISYAYSEMNNPGQGSNMNNGFAYVNETPPIYPVLEHDPITGEVVKDERVGGDAFDYGSYTDTYGSRGYGLGINPAGALRLDKQHYSMHQLVMSGDLEAQLYKGNSANATHDLKLTANVGYQYYGQSAYSLTNMFYGDAEGVGRISKNYYNYMTITANQMLKYGTVIADDHTLDVFVAHEAVIDYAESGSGSVSQLLLPDGVEWSNGAVYDGLSSSTGRERLESYFGQLRYNFADKYSLHATLRGDGSSVFAKGHRWGVFGSVGAAWMMSQENFIRDNAKWIKELKLKASWGTAGNKEIGQYAWTDRYSIESIDRLPALIWGGRGNPNLTWEKTAQTNVGVEFAFFKNGMFNGEIEYYHKNVTNLLFPRSVASSQGYSSYYVNDAALALNGIEFQFGVKAVDRNNVKLNFRLTGAFERDKMTLMPIDHDGSDERMLMNGAMSLGHSNFEWFLPEYMGVDPETGEAMYASYVDPENPEETITNVYLYELQHPGCTLEKGTTKSPTSTAYAASNYVYNSKGKCLRARPDVYGGFGIDMKLYGVDISAFFNYQLGGYGFDSSYAMLMESGKFGARNWHVDMRNAWTETNTNTDVPRLSNGYDLYSNYTSTRFLTSLNALQLANVRIGYSLPSKVVSKMKLNNLNFWVSGENLFVLSARRGYNPFASYTGGSSTYSYSPLSTIMGGIKFQF